MLDELLELVKSVSTGMVEQAKVERGAKWIEAMGREYPIVHRILKGVLYERPEKVLDALASWNDGFASLRRNPHALEYIRQLQLRVRGKRQ